MLLNYNNAFIILWFPQRHGTFKPHNLKIIKDDIYECDCSVEGVQFEVHSKRGLFWNIVLRGKPYMFVKFTSSTIGVLAAMPCIPVSYWKNCP